MTNTHPRIMLQTPLRASDPRPRVELCVWREQLLSSNLPYSLTMGYTAGYPASSTRNKIAKLFLQSNADFLVMLDDDQWPLLPPRQFLDYVLLDYDVLGFPYPSLRINAADPIPWYPSPPTALGAQEVDAVGTGAIIIARRVLAAIPQPFTDVFDADGIFSEGEDLSFCRRAREHGFTIHCAFDKPVAHVKPANMLLLWGNPRWQKEAIMK